VVDSYIDVVNETHRTTSKDILQILTQQKKELDQQIGARETELLALQQRQGVLAIPENRGNLALSRVSTLNQALSQARVRRLELQTRHDAVRAAMARGQAVQPMPALHLNPLRPVRQPELASNLAGAEDSRSNGLRREILQDQLELERLSTFYGPNHPKVTALRERIRLVRKMKEQDDQDSARRAQTELDLAAQAQRRSEAGALEALADQLREAKSLEDNLHDQFDKEKSVAADFTRHQVPLVALETDLEQLRKVYDTVIDRMRQVHLGGDYGVITTQVIEPPQEPQAPIFPDLKKVMESCTLLGLLLGLGICYVFDRWHTCYQGPEDLAEHLGLSVLGHIPLLADSPGAPQAELWLHKFSNSQSIEAEAFRSLRTALMLCDAPPRKLAVTSCGRGDGKTLILTNLAVAFAHLGMRTLLIDVDLR